MFSSLPEIADTRLDGKTAIVTGANSGIGFATAVDLAKRGAKVVLGCRNKGAGEKAVEEVKQKSNNDNVYLIPLDLSSLNSVRSFAQSFLEGEDSLHILINNAGVMAMPRTLSVDGYEMQFAVNHLGHFLLTNLLLDTLKKSAPSRIINVSSDAHKWGSTFDFDDMNFEKNYGSWNAYGRSKLANVLFTKELHKRFNAGGVSAYALQPGVIATNLTRHSSFFSSRLVNYLMSWFLLTPEQGAQTSIFCAVQPGIESLSGEYLEKRAKKEPSDAAKDMAVAEKLWKVSEEMVAPKENAQETPPKQ